MFIKVCGIRSREEMDWARELGYSAVGFVLHSRSPRFCNADRVKDLACYAKDKIATVAVGISFDEVKEVYEHVDFVQLYEYRRIERVIYASSTHPGDKVYAYFLYDASRGSGIEAAFPEWLHELKDRLIISGGLQRSNVKRIVARYAPFGIDISSGVEITRGEKDYKMMKDFMTEVQSARA